MNVYLDNSATTKISSEALEKYNRVSTEIYGNPSSLHAMGLFAEKELDAARSALLTSLGDKTAQVVFTASGSEANNLAITGRAFAKERFRRGCRIITTEGEHASVTAPMENLAAYGFEVVKISTRGGIIDLEELSAALTKNTVLVSVMHVNNETGALYNIPAVSRLVHSLAPEALLHVDATQSYLKFPFTKKMLGADMITVSSHKIEGPKGVGALVIDSAVIKSRGLSPIILGGGQEMGLRSGTENVPAVAAFGTAISQGMAHLSENEAKMRALRDMLITRIESELPSISITRPPLSAPHILNITLPSIKSETMLHYLSSLGIFVSSGSACSSNSAHTSSALTAFGRTEAEADCSIRISFSHNNTEDDVDALCRALADGISRLARIKR